jgi:hypothetical protein
MDLFPMKKQIRSLRPNVTREAAIEQFSPRGLAGCLRRLALGPLRFVAEFYIPFCVYKVTIENNGKLTNRTIALDAVTGALDIYRLDETSIPTIRVETRNTLSPRLRPTEAKQIVVDKIRRVLFNEGFFRLRQFKIDTLATDELCIPYWIGFHGRGPEVLLSVIDAVRRSSEGAKARRLIYDYLVSTGPLN